MEDATTVSELPEKVLARYGIHGLDELLEELANQNIRAQIENRSCTQFQCTLTSRVNEWVSHAHGSDVTAAVAAAVVARLWTTKPSHQQTESGAPIVFARLDLTADYGRELTTQVGHLKAHLSGVPAYEFYRDDVRQGAMLLWDLTEVLRISHGILARRPYERLPRLAEATQPFELNYDDVRFLLDILTDFSECIAGGGEVRDLKAHETALLAQLEQKLKALGYFHTTTDT